MNVLPAMLACATCMPDPNSAASQAASMTIFFMIGILAVVLSIFLKTIFNFARRQRDCARLDQ